MSSWDFFNFENMSEAYPVLRDHILVYGEQVAPRGEGTREVRAMSFQVQDAVNGGVPVGLGRKVGVKMMAIDGTGNLAGASYPDVAIALAPVMDRFADDLPAASIGPNRQIRARQPGLSAGDRFLQGAYGPRIGFQLERVEDQLRRDPDTRQAVVSLWAETDANPMWKDRPCTTEFQLMIRNGKLEMFVFMRANDLWTGTCYDVFQFGQIQAAMAHVLGIEVGPYHHYATSLHIYNRDLDKMKALAGVGETWVENVRESAGPAWNLLKDGEYTSWAEIRERFTVMLEDRRLQLKIDSGRIGESACCWERFTPRNVVEDWYWSVLTTGRAPFGDDR